MVLKPTEYMSLQSCAMCSFNNRHNDIFQSQTANSDSAQNKVRYAVSDCIIEWNQHVNKCAVLWKDPTQTGSPPAAGARASVSNLCIIIFYTFQLLHHKLQTLPAEEHLPKNYREFFNRQYETLWQALALCCTGVQMMLKGYSGC